MNKKLIMVLFVIFCTLCLINTVSASDVDDVISTDDAGVDVVESSEIDESISQSNQEIISDGENVSSTISQTHGTYIGGNGNDKGKGVYTDKEGNIYQAMETNSIDLKTTDNAYQSNITGAKDIFVSKYSADGELIYATYFGGSKTEMQKDLKVDLDGNVYVVGFTNSPDLPVTDNAFQKNLSGTQNAFLTVFNPTGTGLIYSTYLGGSTVDRGWALAIDNDGHAYIQGITNSVDFPVTADAYQNSKDGVNWSAGDPDDIDYQNSFDLFLSKLNIKTGELEYSTFFGAKGSDSTYGSLAVDENEVMYFAGSTSSIDFPVTENAFRDVRDAGSDSFIAALDIKNNKLLFSSYVGGKSTDDGEALFVSENGFLYYVGDTWSEDFPTTEGAYQTEFAGVGESISGGDMFIMKIDTSNWKLVYSTLLGGKYDEGVRALIVDDEENAWVVGMSQSEDYPVTADAYQKEKNGPIFISYENSTDYDYPTHDIVLSKISADGSELLYSTYFGGKSGEFAMGITFVNGGFVLQIRTCSDDLFVTDNTTKGQDQFNGSLLGNDPLYDFDSYLAIFENPTIIKLDDVTGKSGENVTLKATILDSMGNTPLINKTVDFYLNTTLIGSASTDENGIAAITYTLGETGTEEFSVVFNETIGHAAANASAILKTELFIPTVNFNSNSSIIPTYATYLGGNGFDKGKCVYVDKDGNIYVAMESNSRDYNTTEGAFQSEMAGARDIVIAKFSKTGELLYLTYFGGSGNEMHKDFKVDSYGNAYIVGFTNSPNFPTTPNAIKQNKTGIQNAFLAVFDTDGNLIYSTLLGGENVDRAFAVAVDDNYNAYIQGITNSVQFPVTDDAYQKEKKGPVWTSNMSSADITFQDSFDLFITKINVLNSTIEYSTYIGGETMDTTEGSLAVDKNGIIYFGGYTSGLLFDVTDNAYQKEHTSSLNDAFLTVLDPANKKLLFSTYVGGSDDDIGGEIVVSEDGYLYYVGDTWSEDFPVTDNAFQKEFKGAGNDALGGDAFIMKINTTDWNLIYSTYFGGSADDGIGDLDIDEDGNLYLLFSTESSDFPVTPDALQLEKNGIAYNESKETFDNDYLTFDAAVVKLNAEGNELLYSTYIGGSSGEQAFGFTLNKGGFVLFIRTYSGDMFVTPDAYQAQHGADTVTSRLDRTNIYYMDNYLMIIENPTNIKIGDITASSGIVKVTVELTEAMGSSSLNNRTLNFYIDDELIGTAVTDDEGIATFSYAANKTGAQRLTVTFNETVAHAAANESLVIVVAEGAKERKDTILSVDAKFTRVANDFNAGERGEFFYATLTDIDGNPLVNKTIQVAINGPVYNTTTDDKGQAGVKVNLANANTYTYALEFQGDDEYNAAPLASSKLTLTAKKTSISASAKTFKKSAKTKSVSVTLKTSKNPYDGKTYLSAGKTIALKVNGKTYTAKTNAKGVAKLNIKLTKKGTYTAKISFKGDKTYKASSKSIKITIK